uniref:Putative secreted protein n=1 Tax=Anopheles triannulatus TaxID=58253 RepID=A0A2M4B173_9DIPT
MHYIIPITFSTWWAILLLYAHTQSSRQSSTGLLHSQLSAAHTTRLFLHSTSNDTQRYALLPSERILALDSTNAHLPSFNGCPTTHFYSTFPFY